MPLSFPSSPTLGQETTTGGRDWSWNGSAWNLKTARSQHADATDWLSRVTTAGGTVSASTLAAVSTFCYAIENAGIRSSFTRLNLLCGDSLTSALVPLFTSGTRGAAAVGSATDTNVNFVSGDFSDSTGLKGNGTTKYLRTGVTPALVSSVTSLHIAASGKGFTAGTLSPLLGTYTSDASYYSITSENTARVGYMGFSAGANGLLSTAESINLVQRTSSTTTQMYYGGYLAATHTASASPVTSTREWSVFALNLNGTFSRFNAANIWMYSIGASLTAEQVRQYSLAVLTFQSTLGRI